MRVLRLAFVAALAAAPLAAQGNSFYDGTTLTSGVQFKSYSFGSGAQFEKASQVAVPIAIVFPSSQRLSFDLGTFYATTSSTSPGGGSHSFSGITDVQLRGAYTLGRDAAVLSVLVNLPTGPKFDSADAVTAGAAASNFLLFPVNSYSNGLSVTSGIGYAKRVGEWGIGIAGSARWGAEYSPYDGPVVIGTDTFDFKYKPGVEGRVRLGADRSMGQGRMRLGLTFSTFGDDTKGAGSGADVKYSPGNRFIAEGSYAWPGFGGTLTAYVWDYYRASGADSATVGNGENILTAGLSARRQINPNMTFEPALEGRFWSQSSEGGGGTVIGVAAGVRRRLNEHYSIIPALRGEFGSLSVPGGGSASLTGIGASVFIRYGF